MMQQDDLNILRLRLRREPGLVNELREALVGLASTPEYAAWDEEEQFQGSPFHIPSSQHLVVLERVGLVAPDRTLLVKINLCDGDVFLTDGLWVPGEIRVFPFHDESDNMATYWRSAGLEGWATCLIDPTAGCGQDLIRYKGTCRRYGFDISTRSLTFCTLNAALAGTHPVFWGIHDLYDDVYPVSQLGQLERILFLIDAPSTISATSTLPTSSDGGGHGTSHSVAALEAVARFEVGLWSNDEVRVIMSSYSLGNTRTDRWLLVDAARKLFRGSRVRWTLLTTEPMWRVDGRKRQPNPMPLQLLPTKADCRFYVENIDREKARNAYERLALSLRAEGWDALGYGILEILPREIPSGWETGG